MSIDVGWQAFVSAALVAIALLLAAVAWRNRGTRGARDLAALLLASALWNGLAPVTIAVESIRLKSLLVGLMLTMLAVVVYYLATFSVEYSGRGRWLTRRRRLLMAIHPVALIVLTVSDTSVGLTASLWEHSLLFAEVVPDESHYGTDETWGPAFWIHTVYSYSLVVLSIYLIIDVIRSSNSIYSTQSMLLAGAVLTPLTSNALDLFVAGISNTTGIGFGIAGILLTIAVRDHELSDITPVARDTVLDAIDGGVLVLDGNDQIVDANPVAKTFLELDSDVIGQPAAEALSHLDDVWERYEDVYETRDEVAIETDGGWRYYVIDISPLEYASEDGTARTILVNDVTEQKKRERKLENQKERLDEFAGLLSHDLQNPLMVAKGELDMLDVESERIGRIEESHERMETLIEETLTITRTGEPVSDTEPVSIDETAYDAWRMVETGDLTLSVETDLWIDADEARLTRAFENLFRNAVEHGGDEVTEVKVGVVGADTSVFDPEQQGVYVADDGPGIPPDERHVVLEAGHTTEPDGTGLGLSIVESVADAHGWTVAVTESESGGARFELRGAALRENATGEQLAAGTDD